MNLSSLADQVTKRIGMVGDRDVAFCKTSLTSWHDRIYRARLWKDSLIEYVLPIDPNAAYVVGANYLPSQGVVVLPSIFALVSAVRTREHALGAQRPMLFYRVDQDSFVKTGVPLDYMLLPAVAAAFDTAQAVTAVLNAADVGKTFRVATVGPDNVSEVLQDVVTANANQALANTATLLRFTKPATQQAVTVAAGNVNLFTLQSTDTTAPKLQRVRLVDIPDTATTVRILGKRNTPTFSGDNDEPGVAGMEGILLQLAYYDMLCRDERGGTPEATNAINLAVGPRFMVDGTAGGLLKQLEEEEVSQAAFSSRIVPDNGLGPDNYYIGPLF